MITRARRAAAIALMLLGAGCVTEPAPPVPAEEYALESIDGVPLPVTLLTDYDITVAVISDVIRLNSDSTFLEITRFRGVSSDSSLVATDSLAGTYTVSGRTITFLTRSAAASRLTIEEDALVESAQRRLIYRRLKRL